MWWEYLNCCLFGYFFAPLKQFPHIYCGPDIIKSKIHHCGIGSPCRFSCIWLCHLDVWRIDLTAAWWLGMLFHLSYLGSQKLIQKLPSLWVTLPCHNIVMCPQLFGCRFSFPFVSGLVCTLHIPFLSCSVAGSLPFMRWMLCLMCWFVLIFMWCFFHIYLHGDIHYSFPVSHWSGTTRNE